MRKSTTLWRSKFARGALLVAALAANSAWAADTLTVYRSPNCGCCHEWADYMKKNGFDVQIRNVPDVLPYEQKLGVPQAMSSCHVATVGGYAIEGHVPAGDVKRLLKERPKATGIAVPGMPQGSPGMEQGRAADRYETLLFDASGKYTVFARH